MEYTPLNSIPYYEEAAKLTEAMGFLLIDIQTLSTRSSFRVSAVVAKKGAFAAISVEELSEVHKALLLRMEALLKRKDVYMELSSPGIERKIKNAAEFPFYIGKEVKLYDNEAGEWKKGSIVSSTSREVVLSVVCDSGETKEESYEFSRLSKAKLA